MFYMPNESSKTHVWGDKGTVDIQMDNTSFDQCRQSCDEISIVTSSAARQSGEACGVARPAESRAIGRDNAVGLSSILYQGQFF